MCFLSDRRFFFLQLKLRSGAHFSYFSSWIYFFTLVLGLERALHRTEAMEPQSYARRKPTESLESIGFGTLILFGVIGGILYLIYLLLKWLFS